jgi:hypothetical protein
MATKKNQRKCSTNANQSTATTPEAQNGTPLHKLQ